MNKTWDHKDTWSMRCSNFTVEVRRHNGTPLDAWEGPNRWAVYAYIYPNHPLFTEFEDNDRMWQPATEKMPLHAGCSFFRVHKDSSGITSFQVGCDYHHLHDQHYTKYATQDEAREVFYDAEELVKFLEEYTAQPLPPSCGDNSATPN